MYRERKVAQIMANEEAAFYSVQLCALATNRDRNDALAWMIDDWVTQVGQSPPFQSPASVD